MYVPEPVISLAIVPKDNKAEINMSKALNRFTKEDPTFRSFVDEETNETIIQGMGELHLEILQHKLIRDRGVNIRVGKPRVAYKEAITKSAQAEGKFIRQTGGHGQYGHVVLKIEPLFTDDGHWSSDFEFQNEAPGDTVPREYIPDVKNGCKDALSSGVIVSICLRV